MGNYTLTTNLSDKMVEEVNKHKQLRHKKSIEETIIDLLNDALKPPQYFTNYDWKKAEDEANYEI
ncbi:MAG: hypothetical protein KAH84_11085 [Thiomargarita sp.]|nr:hypothetical protein [Thiomargarita sp.]